MVVCYEHHMKTDLTGYPRAVRPRDQSIFSQDRRGRRRLRCRNVASRLPDGPDVTGRRARRHAR